MVRCGGVRWGVARFGGVGFGRARFGVEWSCLV